VATLAAPQVEVAVTGGRRTFGAQQVRLIVPAGGCCCRIWWSTASWRAPEPGQRAAPGRRRRPTFSATAVASGGGLRGSLQAGDLALAPLRPLLREFGVHPDRAAGRCRLQVDVEPGHPARVAFDGEVRGLDCCTPGWIASPWRDLGGSFRGLASVSTAQRMISSSGPR
jgi:hypothetical protein